MTEHDYVIVGAGSAGCVLANRLSEDPSVRVRVIEAGGRDRHPNIRIPAAFPNQFHTKLDWDYATEPEPAVNGRSLFIPRGKSVGGSSSMNAMLYVRGRPARLRPVGRAGGAGVGVERRPAVLHSLRRQRPRAVGVSRRRGGAAGLGAALAARRRREAHRGEHGRRHSADRRLQRPRAGRRLDVPGDPARRRPLERGRRLPAPRAPAAEPRAGHRRDRAGARARGRPRRGGPVREGPRLAAGRQGNGRGDPERRRNRFAADPDALRRRRPRRAAGRGRRGAPRAARGRAQPPGPSLLDRALGDLGARNALRRRQAEVPARVAAAALRAPDLDRGRGVRVRSLAARPPSRRPAVPYGWALLRRSRRRGIRRRRDHDRSGARQPAVSRPGLAALG